MNATELSEKMSAEAANIVSFLLPGGKKSSGEWKAGSVGGEPGQSLSVRLTGHKAGVWKDFASGESGDLLDLWAMSRSLSVSQAMTEAKSFLGIRDNMPQREEKTFKRPAKPQCQTPKSAVKEWLNSRAIDDATIAAFKIGEQIQNGKCYAVFPYLREGTLINAKYRNPAEKKDMRQEGGAEPCLFGWHLIDPRTRTIAITEGEIDAMTLHQCGIPALSVNAGAGNHQWIENDFVRLERFSEILVCFDDDEAGKKGADEVIKRLGSERCKIVTFGAKDANQWLIDGACGEDFFNACKDAKHKDPDELRSASEFFGQVRALFYPAHAVSGDPTLRIDVDYPWFEFRRGELTVWTGYNGHGKSLMLSQVLLGLMEQGESVTVFSGEMAAPRLLKRTTKQATGLDRPSLAYLTVVEQWMNQKMWVFNQVGSATLDRLLEVFAYAVRRYGVTHFVVDSLMMTDVPEDGPGAITAQKTAIQRMRNFATKYNIHFHLVAHPRKGADESKGPGKLDVAGSSKITDGADNVFTVWSARKDESKGVDDKPDGSLELQKQRNGETQHKTVWFKFLKDSQQYTTDPRMRPVSYVKFNDQPSPGGDGEAF